MSLYTRAVTITDTGDNTLITVPGDHVAHWSLLFVSNHGGNTNSASVFIKKANNDEVYIIDDRNIQSKDFLQFSDGIFVLQGGDRIIASIGSTGNFGIACTVDILPASNKFNEFNGS